jgi:ADP-ribosylation factor protein 1
MGNILQRLLSLGSFTRECKVLLVGLDGAGKSTLLYRLKLGENVMCIPTIGFSVETVSYKNLHFTVWDVGGQDRIRPLWRHYYPGTDAIVFVVDSADQERLEEAREELAAMLRADELKDAALLVFANKQDFTAQALPVAKVLTQLGLDEEMRRGRRVCCQGSSATTGFGVYEGMEWLFQSLKN